MPIYSLRNKETGEIFEKIMKIAEYQEYLKENSNIERYFDSVPIFGDPVRLGVMKPPADFQKHIIGRIKDSVPGNTLGDRKFQIPREFWVVYFRIKSLDPLTKKLVMRVFHF